MERKYLIIKGGAFYRPNARGYTTSAILAGRYSLKEAISHSHPNGKNGPRDGMVFMHEDKLKDEDWLTHKKAISDNVRQFAATVRSEWENQGLERMNQFLREAAGE